MKKTNSAKKMISLVSSVLLAANSSAAIYAEPDRNLFDETENDVIINESEETAESFLSAVDTAAESEPDSEKLEGTIFYIKQYRDHVVISGIDKEAEVTDVEIPAEINGLPVTGIGSELFENRTTLKSVKFPDSITSIGARTFSGCTSLEISSLPDHITYIGTEAFKGCSQITEFTLHEGLTQINSDAFSGTKLTKITIPSTVNKVDGGLSVRSPFKDCSTLTEVVFADGTTDIPGYILRSAEKVTKVTIPDTVRTIGTYAFSDTSLSDVKLPAGLNIIGTSAFSECSLIKEIELPEGLTQINTEAFAGTKLTKVTIPSTVNKVESTLASYSPFKGCKTLTEVVFADGMTTIPAYILREAEKVTKVTIPETVTSIGTYAFSDTSLSDVKLPAGLNIIGTSAFSECSLIKEIELPEGLTQINTEAFAGTKLTKITIPSTVNKVDGGLSIYSPFRGCSTLTEVVFADGMTDIPAYMLRDAGTVTTLTIPATVKSLGKYSLNECSSLNTVYGIPDFDNIKIGEHALDGVDVDNIKFIADIPVTAPAVTTPAAPAVTSPAVTTSAAPAVTSPAVTTSAAPAVTSPAVTTSAAPAVTSPAVTTSAAPAVTTPAETTPAAPVTTATVAPSAGVKGDVDGDGAATTTDVKNILKAIVGKIKFTEEQNKTADINGDGAVNSADALLLLRTVVGKTEAK